VDETMSALQHFFDADNEYMPHGHCYLWYPEILWLHVIADATIALSYFSIPIALCYFAIKRNDIPFRRVFGLFATFIILCGITHLAGMWVIWNPDYGPQGIIKAITAIVSFFTAIAVWRMLPKALTLPSPNDLIYANEELHKTNLRIEQQVTERTSALQTAKGQLEDNEKALREAYEEARRANQAKSDFLAHMSHEIRTPLSSVITIADLLPRSGNFNAKQQELLDTMRAGAHSLYDLISDILDISKIEAGEFELVNRPFEWDVLIDDTARVIAIRAEEKGITLRTNAGTLTGKWLMGDRARLRQILTNLLGNAVKFTHEGEVALVADVELDTQNHPQLVITISDTGIGIPPEQHEAIFDKFRQSDISVSGNYTGTGLGLAICHHLVGMMDGNISLQSEVGKGSAFTVRIPLHEVSPPEESSGRPIQHDDTAGKTHMRKILLVEDYPGNIIVATTLLDELGYTYDIANTGKQALELQEQDAIYHAVLMDVNMPEMDGLEATREWRKREEIRGEPRTFIIGLTAHAMAGDDIQCLDAGMDCYLAKPLTLEILQSVLEKVPALSD
jgi:signal transduction histidine kinase/CheY-like chemotaxis protein